MNPELATGATILIAAAAIIAAYEIRDRLRDRRPRRTREPAEMLGEVRVPAGHPEHWTPRIDTTDLDLADLQTRLWPVCEWRYVIDCPRPHLTGYGTRTDAELARDRARRSRVSECRCGAFHIRYPRRRAAR
ncbi:hypothetical protein ACNF49_13965 [Actinomadura sp. ATCC 39365]